MDIELNINEKDINDVINSDPMIKLRVQNAALKRHLEAAIEEINVLKGVNETTQEGKKNAKSR
tara:strand:+ start:629 stop:817 length:189 start_codon:yes stop_codon:yes gene_type:complete